MTTGRFMVVVTITARIIIKNRIMITFRVRIRGTLRIMVTRTVKFRVTEINSIPIED